MINLLSRYRQAARERFDTGEGDVTISGDAEVRYGDEGAWVQAQLFVPIDALDPVPGPTYDVWMAERTAVRRPGPHRASFCLSYQWSWVHAGTTFTCDNDPDGKGARRAAHDYARYLRSTYPCAFVAVRPNSRGMPLPIAEECE
jgi:hypothetical protein